MSVHFGPTGYESSFVTLLEPLWPGKNASFHLRDVNHDGRLDGVLEMGWAGTLIACDTRVVILRGKTVTGIDFIGRTEIIPSGCPAKPK